MAYNINTQIKQAYIRIEISGDRTPGQEAAEAIQFWSNVADLCRQNNIFKVLTISALTGRLPTMQAFEIARSPESFGWSWEYKVAFVDLNEGSRQDNLFTETVAVNRGYGAKIFDNEFDAKAWLFYS